MYKHWKKIILAVTAFFWNACDNSSTPTAPVNSPDSSSNVTEEQSSSSAAGNSVSSSAAEKISSSAVSHKSSSSSRRVKSSSSSVKERISSSSLDQNADLYGCPPDICGPEPSSSSAGLSSSSPVAESSSGGMEAVPLYGVSSNICEQIEGDSLIRCNDGVTCVESVADESQIANSSDFTEVTAKYGVIVAPKYGTEVAPKYGVVIIKDKKYKCDDGKVYNEAEFNDLYRTTTVIRKSVEKVRCYTRGEDLVECDDGQSFSVETDKNGRKVYKNEFAELNEKDFLNKYVVLDQMVALYGPPCMFNGTCDDEK